MTMLTCAAESIARGSLDRDSRLSCTFHPDRPIISSRKAIVVHPDLGSLRARIDRLNAEILVALQRRAETVLEIAELKQAHGLDGYDAKREEDMLHGLLSANHGPFGPDEVKEIFT